MPVKEPSSSTWQEAEGTCVQQAPLPFLLHQMCLPPALTGCLPARHQTRSLLQKGCPTSSFDRQAQWDCGNAPYSRHASRHQETAGWAGEQAHHLLSHVRHNAAEALHHLDSMPAGSVC